MTPTYNDLLEVVHLMQGFPAPWYVSGGWAIDAFLGASTREHEDLEIGIARDDQGYLHRRLAGWQLFKLVPQQGEAELVRWPEGELLELPIHQIVARCEGAWPPEFEFFLNEVIDGEWRFRRDESIRRPLSDTYLLTENGIPIIAPEIQLLFKARGHRPKDEHDFRAVLPHLGPSRRAWLMEALRVHQPSHPWLEHLTQLA